MHAQTLNVLMYHSISDGAGPTCIPREVFSKQLDSIVESGFESISLNQFIKWHRGDLEVSEKTLVITFDDGFEDFAEHAYPELSSRGLTATVFLPTKVIGGIEDWEGKLEPTPRQLMTWDQIRELADRGIEFGGHTLTHADLTQLDAESLKNEISESREMIEAHLGEGTANTFAPPYGRCNDQARAIIQEHFDISVGVTLRKAGRQCNLFEVPRIEMHYFRDIHRWNAFLNSKHDWYFQARRFMRSVRRLIQK